MNPEELDCYFPELFGHRPRRAGRPAAESEDEAPAPYLNRPVTQWNQINPAPLVRRYDGPSNVAARVVKGKLIIEWGK